MNIYDFLVKKIEDFFNFDIQIDKGIKLYGVWCEPKGHNNEARWLSDNYTSYHEAIELATKSSKANEFWSYSVKEKK